MGGKEKGKKKEEEERRVESTLEEEEVAAPKIVVDEEKEGGGKEKKEKKKSKAKKAAKEDEEEESKPATAASSLGITLDVSSAQNSPGGKRISMRTPRTARTTTYEYREGQVFVHVMGATDLKKAVETKFTVHIGAEDSAKDSLKNAKYTSQAVKKNVDPTYAEGSKVFPVCAEDRVVKVTVWSGSSFMGQVAFSLDQIFDGVPRQGWYALQSRIGKKDKVDGELQVQILFLEPGEDGSGAEFKYPLQTFIRKQRIDVVDGLLAGAEKEDVIEKEDADGFRPLHVAGLSNFPDAADTLITEGADVKAVGGAKKWTPLHAAATGSPETVRILLEHHADVSVEDADGNTPLHIAALNNQPKSVEYLVKIGHANLNAQNHEGEAPLHLALSSRSQFSAEQLYGLGANIYVRTNADATAGIVAQQTDIATLRFFMQLVGVLDYHEIAVLENFPNRQRIEAEGLDMDLAKSPQLGVRCSAAGEVTVLVHHQVEPDNDSLAYAVLPGTGSKYRAPTWQELSVQGFGRPFKLALEADKDVAVATYLKRADVSRKTIFMVFHKADAQAPVVELLQPWPHEAKVEGQWVGKSAGGCMNEKTWHKNPYFQMVLPKQKTRVQIVLAQNTESFAGLGAARYTLEPTKCFIGFYIYDEKVEELITQIPKYKNAAEVTATFVFDGSEQRSLVIIPTTFKAGEENSFTLSVLSDHKLKLRPHSKE